MPRVSKQNPCPICGKSDWCLTTPDSSAAICQRVREGAVRRCGDAGWLHLLRDDRRNRPRSFNRWIHITTVPKQTADFEHLARQYEGQLTTDDLNTLAACLGVSTQSLQRLHVGWDDKAYTFPISNSDGRIIGIRRRFISGYKVSVTGGKTGLFVPSEFSAKEPLLICEGPTDTAAALDLGYDAIGRPNCNSRIEMTLAAAKGRTEIVIVGDADKVGRAGAERLADALVLHYLRVKIIYPPNGVKDLRQWLQGGLTREMLQQIINEAEPIRIGIGRSMEACKHEGN